MDSVRKTVRKGMGRTLDMISAMNAVSTSQYPTAPITDFTN